MEDKEVFRCKTPVENKYVELLDFMQNKIQMHMIPKQTILASTMYIKIKTKTPLILTTVTIVTLCLGVEFVYINEIGRAHV